MISTPSPNPRTGRRSPAPPSVTVLERRRAALTTVSGVLVVGVGAAAALGSRTLGYWTALGPGPGFLPLCLGLLLVVLGTLWLVKRALAADGRGRATETETETETETASEEFPEYSLPTVVAIVASLIALAATLEVLGYQLAMLLFLLFHLLVLGRRRLLLSGVIALAGSIGVFVVFTRLLTVPLPASSIPFLRDLGF